MFQLILSYFFGVMKIINYFAFNKTQLNASVFSYLYVRKYALNYAYFLRIGSRPLKISKIEYVA